MFQPVTLQYHDATTDDARLLSLVASESKRHWGYPEALIQLWKDDLDVSAEYILRNKVMKVLIGEDLIGFFAIRIEAGSAELDHLWIRPGYLKRGYGRSVFDYVRRYLERSGIERFTLVAEPNATGFYTRMSGRVIGNVQGRIAGRVLDIYEFQSKVR